MRIPTVFNPAFTFLGITFLPFKIKVNGPGKKASISFCSITLGSSTSLLNISKLDMWIIKGLSLARFFALKIKEAASLSKAFAPIP